MRIFILQLLRGDFCNKICQGANGKTTEWQSKVLRGMKARCLMCPVSRALSHEAPPFVPEGAASRSRTQHLGLKSRNTKKAQATKDRRRAAARRSVHADAGSQNLPFFAPSLLALLIRGGQSHPDQTPDCVGTRWKAGLPAAPFINVLLPLQLKSKTDDWSLPNPRATALFSYY